MSEAKQEGKSGAEPRKFFVSRSSTSLVTMDSQETTRTTSNESGPLSARGNRPPGAMWKKRQVREREREGGQGEKAFVIKMDGIAGRLHWMCWLMSVAYNFCWALLSI